MLFLFVALIFVSFIPNTLTLKYECNRKAPCGCSRRPVTEIRIVNGERAKQGTWSWTVSLRDKNGHFCGGSVLNERYVITAAHCRVDQLRSRSNITVCAGIIHLNATCRQQRKIKNVISHPAYDDRTFENDIALLEMDVPFNFNYESIARICLPERTNDNEYPKPGTDVFAVGWGRTEVDDLSKTLQQVRVQVLDEYQGNCDEESVWYNQNTKLCAAAPGKDACDGDSGGPLMFFSNSKRWELIGITSYGHMTGCATEYPGVYTRVTAFLPWIRQFVKDTPFQSASHTHSSNTVVGDCEGSRCGCKRGFCWAYIDEHYTRKGDWWCHTQKAGVYEKKEAWQKCTKDSDCFWSRTCGSCRQYNGKKESRDVC